MMFKENRLALMLGWSLISVGAIALFWGIWYAVTGSVPVVSEIKIMGGWVLPLPFVMSRFWDILLGPLSAVAAIGLFGVMRQLKSQAKGDVIFGFIFALVYGIIWLVINGYQYGFKFDLGTGISFGLDFSLALGVAFGLSFSLRKDVVCGFALGAVASIAVVVTIGVVAGLTYGILSGVCYGLVVGIISIMAYSLAYGVVSGIICGVRFIGQKIFQRS